MKKDQDLIWETKESKLLLHTAVFDVIGEHKAAASGLEGDYVAIEAPEWVVVVAQTGDSFLLVRQWRHGEGRLTLEFPAGVVEPGEDPARTAARELEEETGFRAGKLSCLGKVSGNPALFRNHMHVFLAEELEQIGDQQLDPDEFIRFETIPIREVVQNYGNEELTHAFMGTALCLYFRHRGLAL